MNASEKRTVARKLCQNGMSLSLARRRPVLSEGKMKDTNSASTALKSLRQPREKGR
jgi:hypothetical protein